MSTRLNLNALRIKFVLIEFGDWVPFLAICESYRSGFRDGFMSTSAIFSALEDMVKECLVEVDEKSETAAMYRWIG